MSFPRHEEIFPSDGDARFANAPAHRVDEFPAEYSSASCSPAAPASASPASASLRWWYDFAYRFAANGNVSLFPLSHPWGALHYLSAEWAELARSEGNLVLGFGEDVGAFWNHGHPAARWQVRKEIVEGFRGVVEPLSPESR